MSSLLIIFMFVIFRFKIMASFSPLVAILNQNKLTGSNYVDWKRNLDIVLIAEQHKYVLNVLAFHHWMLLLRKNSNMIVGRNLMRWPMLHPSIYFKCSTASNAGCRISFRHYAKSLQGKKP